MGDGLFRRGDVWYAWIAGQRVSTGCRDKTAAKLRRAELERRAADPAYRAAIEATLAGILADYVKSRRARGRSAGTLHHIGVKGRHLLRLLPKLAREIDHAALETYCAARVAEGAAATTVAKELRVLGGAWKLARRNNLVAVDFASIKPEWEDDYTPRERWLHPWEIVALASVLPPQRAAHLAFIVATGARWGESLRVTWVHTGLTDVFLPGTKTKKSKRLVPIPGPFMSLYLWARAQVAADINEPGTRLFANWSNVRRDIAIASAKVGIPTSTPNDWRRTFGTLLRKSGVSPDTIALAMGHVDSRMVERVYGRLGEGDLAKRLGGVLLMGGETVESGHPRALPAHEPASESSAQGRNRTADTGIFNPPESGESSGEEPVSGRDWAANGRFVGPDLAAARVMRESTIDRCKGAHPPEWDGDRWVCARGCGPLDARARDLMPATRAIGGAP